MIVAGGFRGTIDFDDTATKTANAICTNSIICGLFAASFDGAIPAVNWVTSGTVANATDNGSVHDVDFQDDIALVASFTGDSVAWQGGKTAPAVGFTGAADVLVVKLASSGGATWLASHGDPSGSDAGAPSGASRVDPNNVVIAKDKTIVVTGDFNGRVKVGSTTLTATVSTGPSQLDDGYIAGFSANDGSGLWAKQVSGNDFETVPALLALSSGNVLAATRYRSGGIVVDNTLLATPAPNGAGLALLEYTTGGVLASATSSASMDRGLGPRLAHLPNDGIGIAMAINGKLKLGPLSITSGSNGTAPTTFFAGYTP